MLRSVLVVGLLVLGSRLGLTAARSAIYSEESPSSIREEQCHDGCIKKFATDDISCLQAPECSTCWDDCSTATTVNRPVTGTTWPLAVTSMVRDGSLVATNVAWHSEAPGSPMALSDCLVTWEVSGGGLIGNLLTSTSFVELSLWPNTKYRIQVTCKRKETGELSRSVPLTLDTSDALVIVRVPTMPPSSVTHGRQHAVPNAAIDDNSAVDSDAERDINGRYSATYMLFDRTARQSAGFGWSRLAASVSGDMMLGFLAAVVVFAAVVAVFVVSRRKSRQAAALVDKTPLVDNEVSVHVDADRLTIHV